MNCQTTLYDAFTGINQLEKSAVVNFLFEFTPNARKRHIQEAVEYALKNKPSFGGFILTAKRDSKIIAAIVANRTGMSGYNANNIFVYVTLHDQHKTQERLALDLLRKAIKHAAGDIAMHVEPGNPALKLYEKLGFQPQYLELRFSKSTPAVA